jgi:tRNA threonylcarbamoyl adenosine modification protein YjeE
VGQTLVSPTFVLVREYTRPGEAAKLYHVDLYRITGVKETLSLGVDEFLGDAHAVSIVEWAERARQIMPPDRLWIELGFVDQTRRTLNFVAQGERHTALLREFRRTAFGG